MSPAESTAIKVCRVLCIFFMTYVHVNPGLDSFAGALPEPLRLAEWWLSDLLGRASVPALSVLGGYLAVAAYMRRAAWWRYVRERGVVLMVPMISWNLLIILLSLLIWWGVGAQTAVLRDMPVSEWASLAVLVDRVTGYDYGAATTALNFLRDLFICSLVLPVLLLLMRRAGAFGLALLWLGGLTLGFDPLIMRPHILMFFAVGVYVALHGRLFWPSRVVFWRLLIALSGSMALVAWVPPLAQHYAENLAGTMLRLVVAALFLLSAYALGHWRAGRWLACLEPLIYLLFLAHGCIMLLFWGVWQQLFGAGVDGPYLFFYLAAPPLTLLVVLVLQRILQLLPRPLQRMLSGKTIDVPVWRGRGLSRA